MARVEEVCAIVLETEPTPDVILLQVRAECGVSEKGPLVNQSVAISSRGLSINQRHPSWILCRRCFQCRNGNRQRTPGALRHRIGHVSVFFLASCPRRQLMLFSCKGHSGLQRAGMSEKGISAATNMGTTSIIISVFYEQAWHLSFSWTRRQSPVLSFFFSPRAWNAPAPLPLL